MPRVRRSTRSSTAGVSLRAPYSLRSRTRARYNFLDSLSAGDGSAKEAASLPKVEKLDMCSDVNSVDHHTDQYAVDYLVLRRGQPFQLKIKFNRKLNDDENATVILTTGRTPYPSKGTLLSFHLRKSVEVFGWEMESSTEDEQEFTLEMNSSAEAIIGKYKMVVQISSPTTMKTSKLKETFCLLFNPWNPKDDVYMEGDDQKEEYVMNTSGRIWVGTKDHNTGRPWIFGQFEENALEAALYVLEISDLPDITLSNPVLLSRIFTKMSNSFDDDGILEGNWTGDYSGGVEPTDWVSSIDILDQYMETKESVKYGQCWVFSGIITTLLRAVGIPARSVTNFESAHDTDSSMTIDRHWNYDDKPLTDLNDSIWNFHVWNEAWFKRADLPSGHDGWQAVDGTPQENSEGVMQCGPASVIAIKEGDVYLPYDAKFIIAEVNGDIIEWVKQKSGEMRPVWKEPDSVGFNISTKAVGSQDRNDVTNHYKYKEGSEMERKIVSKITKYSARKEALMKKLYHVADTKSVEFSLGGVGYDRGDVEITLKMTSLKSTDVTIDVSLTFTGAYYNGSTTDELKAERREVKLSANGSETMTMMVTAAEYLNKIATDASLAVFCKAQVLQTHQYFFKKESYFVDRPDVVIRCASSVNVDEEFPVEVSFTNTLSIPLTECSLILSGPGLQPVRPVKLYKSSIDAGETVNQTFNFRARVLGVREMVALLHTRQLQNVVGSATLKVMK